MKPLKLLASAPTRDGLLELKSRGPGDFLLTLDRCVLMTSTARRSEEALGAAGCAHLRDHPAPRVLVGGLGMGLTLRAALDALPPGAQVHVAELNPVIVEWCRGPLSGLTSEALSDARVTVHVEDVTKVAVAGRYDAVLLDLYEGPGAGTPADDVLYGARACARFRNALSPGGVFGVWGEAFDEAYVRRLTKAGFEVRVLRPGRGGLKHVIFLGTARG